MYPLPPVPSPGVDTAVWHGGNEYGGPGAWKRPPGSSKKRLRSKEVATSGPLDLTAFFGEKWLFARMTSVDPKHHNHSNNRGNNKSMRRSKTGKAQASQMRLESLSLAMAPSHGAGGASGPVVSASSSTLTNPAPAASSCSSASDDAPPRVLHHSGVGPLLREVPPPQPVDPSKDVWEDTSEFASPPHILDHHLQRQQQQQEEHFASTTSTTTRATAAAVVRGSFERCHTLIDDAQLPPASSLLPKQEVAVVQTPQPPQESNTTRNALRVPSVTAKMSVDDKYNAELLHERAMLRALLAKQKQLVEAMRLRRLEACLRTRGGLGALKRGRKQMGRVGRRGRHNNNRKEKLGAGGGGGGGGGEGGVVRMRDPTRSHPLLFMAEGDVQKIELTHMRLEDAEATHLLKLEEAQRRKQDYAMYYEFALRYGPLTEDEFELADFPGRRYHVKNSDASRAIQNWWWSVWPPTLRRRKAAALAIQSLFRGFLQRRRWYAIIRLRTLWGNTRIAAHAFLQWKNMAMKVRKAKTFARRLRYRCEAQCFAMLVAHARRKHQSREEVLRRRLQKVSEGVRLRVFESWVSYTETSLAVERLRRRSLTRPAFRVWGGHASENRRHNRLCSASATIVHKVLGWRRRARYVNLRRVCVNMQVIMRTKINWIHGKRKVRESLMRQAEEAVQELEDWRVRRLMDVEQQRRGKLQAAIDRDASLTQQAASAFLRTSDGKNAVASRLTEMKKKEDEEEEEEEETKGPTKRPGRGGSTRTVKRGRTAGSTAPDVEARKEVVRTFVRQRQAVTRHDFSATSPPPLRCPRADCDATFVNPNHYVRHATDLHPRDNPGIAELALVMHAPVGLALLESWIDTSTAHAESFAAHADRERAEEVLLLFTGENRETADNALALWKTIEEWRTEPSASDEYQQLGRSILNNKFASSSSAMGTTTNIKGTDHLPGGEVGGALAGSEPGFSIGNSNSSSSSLGTTNQKNASMLRVHPTEFPPSEEDTIINPLGFEEASWRALVSLSGVVGRAFLTSVAYAGYLDEMGRPRREAIKAAATGIAKRRRAESLAEARELREAAFVRAREAMVDDLAENALTLFVRGTGTETETAATSTGFLGDLVDGQAALLSVVIIAERSAFVKIISAVWNEAINEAAAAESTASLEQRKVSPAIADTLSEAASAVARSRVMDKLIDDRVLDLTGPQGELWADARAMAAVADGVGYRVRCDVIEDMLEASVFELQESGEVERLMSDAERRRGEEAEAAGNAARAGDSAAAAAAAAAAEEEEGLSEATGGAVVVATPLVVLGAAEAAQQEEPSVDAQGDIASTAFTADVAVTDDTCLSVAGGGGGGGGGALGFLHGKEVFPTGDDEGGGESPRRGWEGGETDGANNNDNHTATARISTGIRQEGAVVAVRQQSVPLSPEDAAVVVQSAWRRKAVYRAVRTLVAQNFVKLYDPAYGTFYWYNQATGESTWEKPAIIDAYFKTAPNTAESLDG